MDSTPTIVGFLCNWCSYAAADLAGNNKLEVPTVLKTIRVMCSSRVDPVFILSAFMRGADGILIEVHPDPENAWVDPLQSLNYFDFEKLVKDIEAIARVFGKSLA